MVSNSRNKIHQTWSIAFSQSLYFSRNSYFTPTEQPGTDETGDGISCEIPFWYAGKIYHNCTQTSAFTKRNGKPWCAIIKTDSTKYEYSLSEWGDCRQECNKEGNFFVNFLPI